MLSILAPELGLPPNARVPYAEWVERIKAVSDEHIVENPAKKLLGFFEGDFEHMSSGEVIMDTAETRGVSETLRQTEDVGGALLRKYVDMWTQAGYLA